MNHEHDTTVTFNHPVPKAYRARLLRLLMEGGFVLAGWDGDPIESMADLSAGVNKLFACSPGHELMVSLTELAVKGKFSIVVHTDWHGSYEDEIAGQILAYDATDGRRIHVSACRNKPVPVLTLDAALSMDREEMVRRYTLPKDLPGV